MSQQNEHIPVLSREVIEYLSPEKGDSYVDFTAGYGGHAQLVIDLIGRESIAVLVDRDAQAQAVLSEIFSNNPGVELMHMSYEEASQQLVQRAQQFDCILADIGLSSPHIDNVDRGFSLIGEAALDMRMDQTQQLSAADVVNTYSTERIEQILREYGEEPKARRIAQMITEQRPLTTTRQLADIVKRAWPRHSRTHPATRTFQAIRIEVNDELGQLKRSLPNWFSLLKPNGRLAVISFHSLEDRVVKQYFRELTDGGYDAVAELLTKKPITASAEELVYNPRARSAKLRAIKRK